MGALAQGRINGAQTAAGTSRASSARAALIGALASISGVSAGTSAPDVATPGAAWPRWVQTTYNGHLCAVSADQYDVYVVLPGEYLAATVESGDELRDLIEPALAGVAVLAYSEPVAIQFNDNQTMPGLRFRVTVR